MPYKTLYFLTFFLITSTLTHGHSPNEYDTQQPAPIGLSSWVDKLKQWIGLPNVTKEIATEKDQKSPPTERLTDVTKESQGELKNPTTLAQPTFDEKEKQKRLKDYQSFEKKILKDEEETIASIEDETREKIDILMQDQRVTVLAKKNPDITLEELPEDIYLTILDLSNDQEKRINQMTDETDQKLKEKAKALEIEHELNQSDSRDNDERKPSTSFAPKTKVMDIGRDEDEIEDADKNEKSGKNNISPNKKR